MRYKNSLSIHEFTNEYHEHIPFFRDFVNRCRDGPSGPEGNILIICLGEIDARCLIHKQVTEKNRSEDSVIEDLVNRYFNTLDIIFGDYCETSRVPVWIMSVIPTSVEKDFGHEFNQRGSVQERKRYTEKLNDALRKKCEGHNYYHFFDIYDLYLDPNTGTLNQALACDDVHIGDNSPIKNKIVEDLEIYLEKYT
jgi:hypothetical protein